MALHIVNTQKFLHYEYNGVSVVLHDFQFSDLEIEN